LICKHYWGKSFLKHIRDGGEFTNDIMRQMGREEHTRLLLFYYMRWVMSAVSSFEEIIKNLIPKCFWEKLHFGEFATYVVCLTQW